MSRTTTLSVLMATACALAFLAAGAAQAYERYNDGCADCHGAFTDDTSPLGTVFPSDDKHTMHRASSNMNADCDLCHTAGDGRDPFIGSSDGTANNTGYGCVGCHGRVEDAGNDDTSAGLGAGLRQHHTNAGEPDCLNCHSDADPSNYTPVGEDVFPPYYGTVDNVADEPCNATATADLNENWSVGDFVGLDNDGDDVYDASDSDCAAATATPTTTPTSTPTATPAASNTATPTPAMTPTATPTVTPTAAPTATPTAPPTAAPTATPPPADADGDGVPDDVDNCINAPNPNQDDSDSDLCGNQCDTDYNQDGLVSILDFGTFRTCFSGIVQGVCDHAPEILDGVISIFDFGVFAQQFTAGAPGPGQSAACNGL